MLNLSKDELRLLVCALRDAGAYNRSAMGSEGMEDDDNEECRIASADFYRLQMKLMGEIKRLPVTNI